MRKNVLLFFILTFGLASCRSAAQSTPASSDSGSEPEVVLEAAEELPTATIDLPEPTETPADTGGAFEPVAGGGTMEGCTIVSILPEPDPTAISLFPPVSDDEWIVGPGDAAVTVVEYGDFQ